MKDKIVNIIDSVMYYGTPYALMLWGAIALISGKWHSYEFCVLVALVYIGTGVRK